MQASYVEVRTVLKNIYFPISKQKLIQQAIKHGASNIIINDLKSIPDIQYTSYYHVVSTLAINKSMCILSLKKEIYI
jgi:hypothetical protein